MTVPKSTSTSRVHDDLPTRDTLHPYAELWLRYTDILAGIVGVVTVIVLNGFRDLDRDQMRVLASAVLAANLAPLVSLAFRYVWSRARSTFLRVNSVNVLFGAAWLAGLLALRLIVQVRGTGAVREEAALWWSEAIALGRGGAELIRITRHVSHARFNPALVLVLSFVVLIASGTLLLMLPRCRPAGTEPADWLTALFTATSACCVTGLVVVDTGTYWSRAGQCIILMLIQLGGLGIMTFGAFFAFVGGRSSMREAATMADLLESQQLADVGRLIRAILGFTIAIEATGAVLLSGLWADRPPGERAFQSVFHAVSAFCNAGFSTRAENLMHWELRWQVWGVVAGLIILGGFGFISLDNLFRASVDYVRLWRRSGLPLLPRQQTRLSLTTRMVLVTTLSLLIGGTLILLAMEWNNPANPREPRAQLANAWFHAVTLRTAGFNTVDHASLTVPSKLFGIMLMFVGASPGSTGGGVKTVCLAVSVITLRAVLSGRSKVEVMKRTIPQVQIYRGLAIIALALTVQMIVSLLIISIERQPHLALDHLYEVGSALGTVGVSTGVTAGLQPASRLILIVTMLLGRVGALTLVTALAGTSQGAAYQYPEERITLG